jgi:predicted CXXCH cytochrome family protein
MGRSLAPVRSASPIERYEEAAKNPFTALGFRYEVERRDGRTLHRETAEGLEGQVRTEAEVLFAIGSGSRGRSYLIERDGYLFESPITWYPQRDAWDLSPSYRNMHNFHFTRPINDQCLFCHTNRVEEVKGTLNRYREPIFQGHAIGCERCHGPGELHARDPEKINGIDHSIVNPKHLDPPLREAVCEQCHLQGKFRMVRRGLDVFDYRPGLPLHQFMTVLVATGPESQTKFVSHVEQMHLSGCFKRSKGKLGCISCHDPHVAPAPEAKAAFYRGRCLNCHGGDKGCTKPLPERLAQSQNDSCIQCHVPVISTDIAHTSITDHRIPRWLEKAGPAATPEMARARMLAPFHRDLTNPRDQEEVYRALGIAFMDRTERIPERTRRDMAARALPLLEEALRGHGEDVPALEAKAHALWALGRPQEAADAFEAVLAKAPGRETALHAAASLAIEMDRPDQALDYWERGVRVNRWRYEFYYGLAAAHLRVGEWEKALEECRQALQLNAAHRESRKLLIRCLLELGEKDKARAEFDVLLRLNPSDAEALRRWFNERLR